MQEGLKSDALLRALEEARVGLALVVDGDRLTASDEVSFDRLYEFVKEVGYLFPKIYRHLMAKNASLPFGEKEKQWQAVRRGRYVEFNLVWDAGTKFGLDTQGRTESILMSMPPFAAWEYNYKPEPGSKESFTLDNLKKEVDWINYGPGWKS